MYQSSKKQKKTKKAEDVIIDLDDIEDCEEDEHDDQQDGMPQLLLDDPELDELDPFQDLEYKCYYQRNKSVDVEDFVLISEL